MYDYTYWGTHTLSGLDNMALEEYLLRDAAESKRAHIRFWDFDRDTVVLGYGQALDALKKWDSTFTVTRRATGGAHVHVGKNVLSYTFVVPRVGNFRNHQDFRIYYADHVARALETIGIPGITTDHNASTIMQNGKVIASHAVTWGVNSGLLHGLVHIEPYNMQHVLDRIALRTRTIGGKKYTEADALRHIPTVTNLLQNLKPHATIEQKTQFIKQLLAETLLHQTAKHSYSKEALTENVLMRARQMQENKYASELWIKQRDPTFTPEEIEAMPGEELDGPLKEKQGYCLYGQVPDNDFKKMVNND